jgi:hypothetical protein
MSRNENHQEGKNDDNSNHDNQNENCRDNDKDSFHVKSDAFKVLQQRLNQMRAEIYSKQMQLPPNPNLSAEEFVAVLLEQLHNPCVPLSGFRSLIRSSSCEWKSKLRESIGVPRSMDIDEETFANALFSAMSRPNNQYEILVQDRGDGSGDANYALHFPGDVVDYQDGCGCWVETQLRHPVSGRLFAILGWSLVSDENGAWLVDRLDWQDFRDDFRPGIGREEWMRICG